MNEPVPLFVQYDAEPTEVDPNGCQDIDDLIKKVRQEFSPQLDSFPPGKLTLHSYDVTQLRPGLTITELLNQAGFVNNDSRPLLINTVPSYVAADITPNSKAIFEFYTGKLQKTLTKLLHYT